MKIQEKIAQATHPAYTRWDEPTRAGEKMRGRRRAW